ncbi:hypothetical protein IIF7_03006 [Zunongwangia atlantica 22II14-10F7]|uniref:Uncharacterized protein n=2 Tax=Zunongwangia TaxID=417127 RepID=A0A1Y1T976_9FLAO|nr:hypothetical protein IIF7_03006 [Zunongwangia atlantica 22II14-10F7]
MNLIEWFFTSVGLYFFYELAAAIFSTIFYFKYARSNFLYKCLMCFFWWTWFADTGAKYAALLYLNEYQFLDVRNTVFERSGWVYNIVCIVSILFYTWFYHRLISNKIFKKTIKILGITGALLCVILYFTTEGFWVYTNGNASFVRGIIVIIYCVLCFLDLMNSEQFISFYKFFGFYFTIGIFIFYLLTTPLFIYSKYFTWDSYEFSMLMVFVIKVCNVVLYSLCVIGYLMAMKHSKLNLKFSFYAT